MAGNRTPGRVGDDMTAHPILLLVSVLLDGGDRSGSAHGQEIGERNMRHTLIILLVLPALVLLAPAVHPASAAGFGANPAEDAFNSVYSADVQRIKAARDPKAAVELATRLLAAAKESKSQPAFQAVLCEKAYELTAPYPSGQPLAVEAMTLLAARVPEKALQSADAIADVRQRQFEAARGEDRTKAGDALLDALLKAAELRVQAGTVADAAAAYKRALAIAIAAKSDRRPAIEAKARDLTQAAKNAADAAMLKKQLEAAPGDAAAREKLVRLCLVCFDDPAAAARYADGVTDAALCKFVAAVAKGIEAAPEVACIEIGNWYASLAETAPGAGSKAAMLSRARTYYMRFLELHMTDDMQRTMVVATVRNVEAEIAKLSAPPEPAAAASHQPTAGGKAADAKKGIDLLALVDVAKDAVKGDWQHQTTGLQVAAKGGPMMLVLPVQPCGSYELDARFVRTNGKGTVIAVLPAGSKCVALCMSWNKGLASALELINGKGPKDNETCVKPGTLQNNHEYVLLVKVLVEGANAQVAVSLDGKPYISWQGPVSALGLHKSLRLPHGGCLGLGAADATVVFGSARLRMLSGDAKPLRP